MKINFKSIFGQTLLIVLVALVIYALIGAPIVNWLRDKIPGMPAGYDGTPMGYDAAPGMSRSQMRESLRKMRAEQAAQLLNEVDRRAAA